MEGTFLILTIFICVSPVWSAGLGDTCTSGGTDCSVTNSKCWPDKDNAYKCSCDNGYKQNDTACVAKGINDLCLPEGCGITTISHLECRKAVDGKFKCLCEAGYKEDTTSSTCEERETTYRLVNGDTIYEGIVEVKHDKRWGSVCSDDFTEKEASVVCRSFGFSGGMVKAQARGSQKRKIWMEGVKCKGSEMALDDCKFNNWQNHECSPANVVSVKCKPGKDRKRDVVRLVDGPLPNKGRVEVYHDGQWGTVCNDDFEEVDAKVVCRQLGWSGGKILRDVKDGSGKIWMDQVECTESDTDIRECAFSGWGKTNCDHAEDVGIMCETKWSNTPGRGNVRLVDGPSPQMGRLEVYRNNSWGTVCGVDFKRENAFVFCTSLGYSLGISWPTEHFGPGTGNVYLKNLNCTGQEWMIDQCSSVNWSPSDCPHSLDVGIKCVFKFESVEYRLADSSNKDKTDGRLEMSFDEDWGTVCKKGFDHKAATAACKSLGMSGGVVQAMPSYGQGDGPIWLSEVNCTGHELKLTDCQFSGLDSNDCTHEDDVAIKCLPNSRDGAIFSLVDGDEPYAGRLIVFFMDIWGTVCSDKFNDKAAKVACKSMNLKGGEVVVDKVKPGTGPIWMDNVKCKGTENTLTECTTDWGRSNCKHDKDVYIKCDKEDKKEEEKCYPQMCKFLYNRDRMGYSSDAGFCEFILTKQPCCSICQKYKKP